MTVKKSSDTFLPNFCEARILFIVVLLGELLAITLIFKPSATIDDFIADLALYSIFIQWVALSCLATLCCTRNYLNNLPDIWAASLSYCLILSVSLIVIELVWQIGRVKTGLSYSNFTNNHGAFILRCLSISAIVGALVLRYFYIRHQWHKNIRLEAEARLQALQARIRPHFFFNCMNTIASMTRKKPAVAEQITEDLAGLFRVYLQEPVHLSTLAEEIALCKRYLSIESHRFGDRLRVIWEIDELPTTMEFPLLILQPVIENAVYNGIEPSSAGGTIRIRGEILADKIMITVANPLPAEGNIIYQGNHMAQENIRQRLSACYEGKGTLLIEADGQQYQAKIIVPYADENIDR